MGKRDEQDISSSTLKTSRGSLTNETEPLWTIIEVAYYLQLEPETVRQMARNQEIPAFKLRKSNRWRFRKEDVEHWVGSMVEIQ
jgi:excisionase family DNA binding protein